MLSEIVFRREHAAMNLRCGGECRQREAERFDHQPAIVTQFLSIWNVVSQST